MFWRFISKLAYSFFELVATQEDVQRLLDLGADVSLRSLDGSSAANWAERFNYFSLGERLKQEESLQSENSDPALVR